MASLDGARTKLRRAARHIDELKAVATQYLESKPFEMIGADDEAGDLVFRIKIARPVPPECAAIVGDAVHNLRSALDLLAWQLVELNGASPSRDTCFPIGGSSKAFPETLKRALAGAHPRALHLLRRLRPYAGGGDAKLLQLHSLDVVDKHRLILIVGAAHKHVILRTRLKVPWQEQPVGISGVDV